VVGVDQWGGPHPDAIVGDRLGGGVVAADHVAVGGSDDVEVAVVVAEVSEAVGGRGGGREEKTLRGYSRRRSLSG